MLTVDLGPENGTVALRTGVEGRAARMGHSLRIVLDEWRARVTFDGENPTAISFEVDLDSMRVEEGRGGVKPLSAGDREAIVRNALDCLDAQVYPKVIFVSTELTRATEDVHITGSLSISGATASVSSVAVLKREGDNWLVTLIIPISQSEFGITAYSTMLGNLRVADIVEVTLDVAIAD